MNRKTITPMGALHPVLFFAGVYAVALVFSIFICSSIFYSCNAVRADFSKKSEKQAQPKQSGYAKTTTAVQ
jgi:hypothetical protein